MKKQRISGTHGPLNQQPTGPEVRKFKPQLTGVSRETRARVERIKQIENSVRTMFRLNEPAQILIALDTARKRVNRPDSILTKKLEEFILRFKNTMFIPEEERKQMAELCIEVDRKYVYR